MEKQSLFGNRNVRIILGFLLFLSICCCVVAFYVGNIVTKSMQPLENADISISLPPIVKIDEDFDFDITITNISTEAITLNSINIGESFVDGILIGDSEPIFELRQRFDMLGIPMEMFVFNEMILVGESLIIQFDAEATSVGDFTGQMFLCVDDTTNCELYLLRTVVEE